MLARTMRGISVLIISACLLLQPEQRAAVPLQITRTCDSRDRRTSDFGVCWSLDIRNVKGSTISVSGQERKYISVSPSFFSDVASLQLPNGSRS